MFFYSPMLLYPYYSFYYFSLSLLSVLLLFFQSVIVRLEFSDGQGVLHSVHHSLSALHCRPL